MPKQKGMIFVQGEDRPGIVRDVTKILFECGANLEDVSMTLLEGQFAMMISFDAQKTVWGKVESQILKLRKKPYSLHTDLVCLHKPARRQSDSEKSLLFSVIGKDRTGIVYRVSEDLARLRANIINLDSRLLSGSKKTPLYSMILEVSFPGQAAAKKIERMIPVWEKKLQVEIKVHSSEAAVF